MSVQAADLIEYLVEQLCGLAALEASEIMNYPKRRVLLSVIVVVASVT